MPPLTAQGPDAIHRGVLQQEHRNRVAAAKGSQAAEFLYGRHRQFRNIGHGIQLERQRLGHRVFFSGPIVDGFAERADLFFFNGQARRSGMPAKAQQQRCASAQSGVQVKAGGSAPTAAALAVFSRNNNGGAAVFFHQAGCHNADYTGVPAFA